MLPLPTWVFILDWSTMVTAALTHLALLTDNTVTSRHMSQHIGTRLNSCLNVSTVARTLPGQFVGILPPLLSDIPTLAVLVSSQGGLATAVTIDEKRCKSEAKRSGGGQRRVRRRARYEGGGLVILDRKSTL